MMVRKIALHFLDYFNQINRWFVWQMSGVLIERSVWWEIYSID